MRPKNDSTLNKERAGLNSHEGKALATRKYALREACTDRELFLLSPPLFLVRYDRCSLRRLSNFGGVFFCENL